MKEIHLPDALARSLAAGHPWVYRDHVGAFQAPSGTWVRIRAASFSAVGLWDAESPIAVRVFSTVAQPDLAWVRERVREAWDLRASVRAAGVTGYRLIFGEADQLPGIVVDIYARYAVLVSYSKSLGSLLPLVAAAVAEVAGVVSVSRRQKDERGVTLSVLLGEPLPEEIVVEEYGMRLLADVRRGQKTGLFFDHRDNREFVRGLSGGASVLNLFSYTGGFSVAAALGGAREVTSVDIAAPAVEMCSRNFALNGLGHVPHEALAEDVFDYLRRIEAGARRFDVVVCDPPSFAKSKDQLRAAEKAYRRLIASAMTVTAPGGILCAASCTSQIGPEAFRQAIADAARKARLRFQIVRDVGHPFDHPVGIGHDEGRYLKFVAGRVLARC